MIPGCTADLVIGGDFEGTVKGEVHSQNRRPASSPAGVIIDAILPAGDAGGLPTFRFAIMDLDGPGPKPVVILFGQEEPELRVAHGWQSDRDPGLATISADGSSAVLDVEFPPGDAAGGTPGTKYTLKGTIACPPLPAPDESS